MILRSKFIKLSAYKKKVERFPTSNLTTHLKYLDYSDLKGMSPTKLSPQGSGNPAEEETERL